MPKTSSTTAVLPQIKAAGLCIFHERLDLWYKAHGRHHLPWRNTEDPYAIWVSEVMLQQTQVATVLDRFYHPFLERFPTIQHLAAAPREQVMKAWEGLGYYRRAGYLHEAAKAVVSRELSVFSKEPAIGHHSLPTHDAQLTTLLSLPGIGRNTATAVLAFAHHRPVAIMEANVKRIVARIFALAAPSERQLWTGAEMLLDAAHPFDYNQSMMDLGSLICVPKNPACLICPANNICLGQTHPEAYPAPKPKKKIPVRQMDIQVTEDASGKLFLQKRSDALLGGLYGFPQIPVIASESRRSSRRDFAALSSELPRRSAPHTDEVLGNVMHIYTHFRLEGRVFYRKLNRVETGPDWHTRKEIAALPLSKVDHKTLALVDTRHSADKKRVKSPDRATQD